MILEVAPLTGGCPFKIKETKSKEKKEKERGKKSMKYVNTTKLFVMNKFEKQGVKDPSKTYYYLVVSQDEDAGSTTCPKEVYDEVETGKIGTFITEYNDKYESFRITGMVKPSAQAADKAKA